MNIYQIDNILTQESADYIEKLHLTNEMPWFFLSKTCDDDTILDSNVIDTNMFFHSQKSVDSDMVSDYYNDVIGIIDEVSKLTNKKFGRVKRIKSNLTYPWPGYTKNNYGPLHRDYTDDHWSFLYYVNDSDGDTRFFDDKKNVAHKATPKKNTGILFQSDIWHAASSPIEFETRAVINFIIEKNE
jgi:hypothetical protein